MGEKSGRDQNEAEILGNGLALNLHAIQPAQIQPLDFVVLIKQNKFEVKFKSAKQLRFASEVSQFASNLKFSEH